MYITYIYIHLYVLSQWLVVLTKGCAYVLPAICASVAVITTWQEVLRVEAAGPGADLLAEYVASRCGIKLGSSLFLKKANPVWHVRRGRSSVTTPLLLEDARQITFCHRVTQEKVKGLVGDLILLPKR